VDGGDTDQASAVVLHVNGANQLAETALVQAINVGDSWPPAFAAMSLVGQTEKNSVRANVFGLNSNPAELSSI
jgi:soluble lytic murein transglycosylase-like protein